MATREPKPAEKTKDPTQSSSAEPAREQADATTSTAGVFSVPPPALSPDSILQLQRTRGNQSVQRLLRRRGASTPAQRAHGPTLQRFEARMHERAERYGLTTTAGGQADPQGLSNEEASAVYFGNWMRDVNQVFVPMVQNLGISDELAFALVSYLAAKKFGREMTPEQFGYYIPAEHIDSPAGLVAQDDLRSGQPQIATGTRVPAPSRPDEFVTPQEDVSPSARVLNAANLFDVDQTGTMAYIRRSNLHVERRLELAVQRGRNPEGMMHFGAAMHAMEDLFTHSNWIEIAVTALLQQDATLLPQLQGDQRRVFNYSVDVEVGRDTQGRPNRRPALMTGSFTGTDTQISIASEIVTFMGEPLPEPRTDAETAAEERFIRALLQAFQSSLQNNQAFRNAIRDLLVSYGVPRAAANQAQRVPVVQLYDISTWLGPILPESARLAYKRWFRNYLSTNHLQPMARQMQAGSLDARVANTSLIQFRREQQEAQQGQFSEAQQQMQQGIERFTGRTVAQQRREAQAAAGRHVAALNATPEPVLAGPSHSQIAKDHANSPFFGLAFTLATVAVRRMREKLVAAWNEAAGRATTPFNFEWGNFPAQAPQGSSQEQTQAYEAARQTYHQTRPFRSREMAESLQHGRETVQQGGAEAQPYDLAAMRRDTATQLRTAATTLRGIAQSPGQTATLLQRLQAALGPIEGERMESIRQQLGRAARTAQAAGQGDSAARLTARAGELDQLAGPVENARTHAQRITVNEQLTRLRQAILEDIARSPVDATLAATLLILLDDQIAYTQVTYSAEQRRILEGYNQPGPNQPHIAGLPNPRGLQVSNIQLPNLAANARGQQRAPALVDLLAESRLLLNHPYESNWWHETVRNFMQAHPAQIMADIEARNEGVPFFRRPGEHRGHGH